MCGLPDLLRWQPWPRQQLAVCGLPGLLRWQLPWHRQKVPACGFAGLDKRQRWCVRLAALSGLQGLYRHRPGVCDWQHYISVLILDITFAFFPAGFAGLSSGGSPSDDNGSWCADCLAFSILCSASVRLYTILSACSLLCLWGWGVEGWRVISLRPTATSAVGSAEMASYRRAAALAVWGFGGDPPPAPPPLAVILVGLLPPGSVGRGRSWFFYTSCDV